MADLTLRGQCEEALRLLRSGEPTGATAIGRRILQAFPKHVGTYSLLGQTCLLLGAHEEAANLFRRVLSADPEHILAHASLAAIYEERGLLEEALWQLERASELSPGNQEIRRELRRLYTERGLTLPARLKPTRAALARTYLRGQLYPKAVGELRELVTAEGYRYDLRVALAEALWRDGRHEEAGSVAQSILAELPNCLKANLILGQVWLHTEHDEEARALLQRAQALDPENSTAQALFGARSPLPPRMARLPVREEDAPPVELPYLVDDEDVVSESRVIEGQAGKLSSNDTPEETLASEEAAKASTPEAPLDEPKGESQLYDASPAGWSVFAPSAPANVPDVGAFQKSDDEEGLSLIDVRRHYVAEHPDDHQARLDLARRLCGIGDVTQATKHYSHLVQEDFGTLPAVIRDLELLKRLYPSITTFDELLRAAHLRESRKP
jgi:tetratricopeptide (TPR) repeat protein